MPVPCSFIDFEDDKDHWEVSEKIDIFGVSFLTSFVEVGLGSRCLLQLLPSCWVLHTLVFNRIN